MNSFYIKSNFIFLVAEDSQIHDPDYEADEYAPINNNMEEASEQTLLVLERSLNISLSQNMEGVSGRNFDKIKLKLLKMEKNE